MLSSFPKVLYIVSERGGRIVLVTLCTSIVSKVWIAFRIQEGFRGALDDYRVTGVLET